MSTTASTAPIEKLPVTENDWRIAFETAGSPLRDRLLNGTMAPLTTKLEAVCETLNALIDYVRTKQGDAPADKIVGSDDLRATVQALLAVELQQLGDLVLSRLDAKVIEQIADVVVSKIDERAKKRGR
jgi:hypothetical protein